MMIHSFPVRPSSTTRNGSICAPVRIPSRCTRLLFVHDQHIGAALIISDRFLRHQKSWPFLDRHAHTGIESRQDLPVGVWEDSPHQQGAGRGGKTDGREIELALMGVALFVKDSGKNRPLHITGLPRRPTRLSHQAGQVCIADVEIDIDGIDPVDLCQDRIFP